MSSCNDFAFADTAPITVDHVRVASFGRAFSEMQSRENRDFFAFISEEGEPVPCGENEGIKSVFVNIHEVARWASMPGSSSKKNLELFFKVFMRHSAPEKSHSRHFFNPESFSYRDFFEDHVDVLTKSFLGGISEGFDSESLRLASEVAKVLPSDAQANDAEIEAWARQLSADISSFDD